MTSTPRFIAWWTLASVPLPWVFERALGALVRTRDGRDAFGFGLILLTWIGVFASVATLQASVLARHRRPVPAWTVAAVTGSILASIVGYSMSLQFGRFVGSFGAVRLPAWWGWAFSAVQMLSMALVIATAQAVALWGGRRPREWPLWVGGRLFLGLAIFVMMFVPEAAGVNVLFSDSFLVDGGRRGAEAVGTAWLMDRLLFRPPASVQNPR